MMILAWKLTLVQTLVEEFPCQAFQIEMDGEFDVFRCM